MKKTVFTICSLVLIVIVSMSFTKHDPRYKNLKVLPQDISEKDMDSVMHHFTASLGVRCNYCHVRHEGEQHPDFASDDNKQKLMAREMMKMTNELNGKYFNVTGEKMTFSTPLMVTCYTCHHGTKEPEVQPQRMERMEHRNPQDSTKRM